MKKIEIRPIDGPFEVDAHVFGDWAAHNGVDVGSILRDDWWVVTHVPNGRRLRCAGMLTEERAVELARALDQRKAKLPLYAGASKVARLEELSATNPELVQAGRVVRSIVLDVLGTIYEEHA